MTNKARHSIPDGRQPRERHDGERDELNQEAAEHVTAPERWLSGVRCPFHSVAPSDRSDGNVR